MRWLLAIVFVFIALATSASAATPALPDPCSLLTRDQIVPVVGGKPTSAETGGGGWRSCTWTGPPLGYIELHEQFMVGITRESRAQFAMHAYRDVPKPDPLPGLGAAAFSTFGGGYEIWQNGYELDLDGSYITVYPAAAKRLAQSALNRL
jgi:hypothetical protein